VEPDVVEEVAEVVDESAAIQEVVETGEDDQELILRALQ
jgi:hypothetical protein